MSPPRTALAPWQQRVYDRVAAALDAGRLGHALLFCGPALLGKRVVAERLAQRVLCQHRAPGQDACGHCRACELFAQRHQLDPVETRPDGLPAHPFGRPGHPDAVFVGHVLNEKARPPKMRTEIVIEQIRQLSERLSLTPQYGTALVALLDPADAINTAAGNALLKTLEEPVSGRYLWLLSAQPGRLPATIRSRCQRIEFHLPPRDEAEAWLVGRGHDAGDACEALDAARGHPGLADAWLTGDGLALRREVAGDLAALGKGRASPAEVAQRWSADDGLALRLRHAADLALADASGLTDPAAASSLAEWFDKANRTRDLLRTTVRADLAVVELLLAWRKRARRQGV
ncbi:DNA polymerase III subunit delta' [Lysobacter sp. SG-8]|uniref:DNA-directed DNA polymerase n=1 Tax=Marilutibacter penaei TaxID=2759900 RepID=A0A7W3U4W1_9GAMM|nr:DNA polymerase III subunit delta' [Lysobacter penaei]MBB1089029.1 DNA polymerase III subunit delta' [Lysobacter penaei]